MTESEFMASTDPAAMLQYVTEDPFGPPDHVQPISDRKLRLFACACVLASSIRIAGTAYEPMLVDGQAPNGKFEYGHDPKRLAEIWCDHDGLEALMLSRHRPSRHPTKAARADLLRHIVGNPFRKYAWTSTHDCAPSGHELQFLDERWRTPTVVSLAQALYDGTETNDGPLHDALLDAGVPEWNELVLHFAHAWPCRRCGGTGWYEDVAGEDLDGLGGREVNVRCEHDDSLVPMVQEHNDGGTSYWFNLLEPNTRHLTPERAQPRHPKGCWALDLLLSKE